MHSPTALIAVGGAPRRLKDCAWQSISCSNPFAHR